MTQVILEGGPHDGKQVETDAPVITTIYMKPLKWPVPPSRPDKPSWQQHPVRFLRWWRWKPPAPEIPPMPEAEQLTYRDTGTTRDGKPVYAIDGGWPWYKGPQADARNSDLYGALATAHYAVHPVIRHDPQTRWVMDLDWYKRIRAAAAPRGETDPDEPDKWEPSEYDSFLGTWITVTDDAGPPYIENRRYPAGWPD